MLWRLSGLGRSIESKAAQPTRFGRLFSVLTGGDAVRFLILTLALTNGTLLSAMLVVTEVPPQGAVRVPYTYTGDGDGFMIGGFDVASSSATDLLYDIT